MNEISQTVDVLDATSNPLSRRALLTRVAVAGLGATALSLGTLTAEAADTPQQPEADTGKSYTMAKPNAETEADFRMGVIGPVMLSLATSKIAVDKAASPQVREFANFELRETLGMAAVLKEMNTPEPPMDAAARASLAKLQAATSADFDREYMTAQLATHEFLRDLTQSYLTNSATAKSMPEMHGRHLATLALASIKEHVVHAKNFVQGTRAATRTT